eukprot:COSAG05_NODE_871_length_6848_cov_2.508372_4_plen_168_part_00
MQGFPDTHFLVGPPDKKFEQVGNAVCARVASAIGKAFLIGFFEGTPAAHTLVEVEPPPSADDVDCVIGPDGATDGDQDVETELADEKELVVEEGEEGAGADDVADRVSTKGRGKRAKGKQGSQGKRKAATAPNGSKKAKTGATAPAKRGAKTKAAAAAGASKRKKKA